MRPVFVLACAAALVLLDTVCCGAQYIAPAGVSRATSRTADTPFASRERPFNEEREISVVGGIVGGTLGSAGGAALGALIGSATASGCKGDFCGLGSAIVGLLIGESVGVAVGTHVGSRSQSYAKMALTTLSSLGIAFGGVFLAAGVSQNADAAGPILVAIPVLQIVTALAIEGH
jgi:hypothetical protein